MFEVSVCAKSDSAPWQVYVWKADDDCEIYGPTAEGLLQATYHNLEHGSKRLAEIVRTFHYAIHKNAMERRAA